MYRTCEIYIVRDIPNEEKWKDFEEFELINLKEEQILLLRENYSNIRAYTKLHLRKLVRIDGTEISFKNVYLVYNERILLNNKNASKSL